jgi:two-component system cell cycle sensor histidine kinase/response regulator CckA
VNVTNELPGTPQPTAGSLLAAIVESADVAIFSKTLDGTVTSWNAAAERMYGYPSVEIVGTPITRLEPEDRRGEMARILEHIAAGEHVDHLETVRLARDGSRIPVSLTVSPVRDDAGRIVGASVIGRDLRDVVEARIRTEGALRDREAEARASEARFRALFEQSAIATVITRDGSIVMANGAAARLFGYEEPEDLIGQASLDRIAEIGRAAAARWRDSPNLRPAESMESTGLRRDGSRFPMRILRDEIVLPEGKANLIYATDLTEQRRVEAEREWLISAVEQSMDSVVVTDVDGRLVYLNAAAERLSGFSREQVLGQPVDRLADRIAIMGADQRAARRGEASWSGVIGARLQDGSPIQIDVTISPVRDPSGNVAGAVSIGRDATRERALEAQLRQSQKMEAIGRLAGGIAHDFNNLLTVVSGNAELLLEELGEDDDRRIEVEDIHGAADRAAGLTRQLLAFSRRQVLTPELLKVSDIVQDLSPLLRRVVGEDVDVAIRTSLDEGLVQADRSQLEQVVMNLVVNARDAMPNGGALTIGSEQIELDPEYADAHLGVSPGLYVQLIVADTGVGMDADTRVRSFEPFFTTKGPGAGTGLGLSTVDGIVRQSGGHIWVYSEPGLGTTFKIFLPIVPADAESDPPRPTRLAPALRRGHILLVEDEPSVRTLTRRFLESAGHTVVEASSAAEAVEIIKGVTDDFDLLLTDVVMPGGDGSLVATALHAARPGAPVLYMSGYSDDTINHHRAVEQGATLVTKPFSRDRLLDAIDAALATEAR